MTEDLLGLYSAQSGRIVVPRFGAGDPTGLSVVGMPKLAQQYLVRICLDRGSQAGEPEEGTQLMQMILMKGMLPEMTVIVQVVMVLQLKNSYI